MEFLSFPDISGLEVVIASIARYPHIAGDGPVSYRGKIKLHGVNAAVRYCNGEIEAQSRNGLIPADDDPEGFRRWLDTQQSYFKQLDRFFPLDVTIFGEWCGQGVKKGTAVSQIGKKIFAVFCVMFGKDIDTAFVVTEPNEIALILPNLPEDVYILPWQGEAFDVEFVDPQKKVLREHDSEIDVIKRDDLKEIAERLSKVVDELEPCDPWVKAEFGVEGVCEGLVFYPGAGKIIRRKTLSDLSFKAKGKKHAVKQSKERVQVAPEVLASIDAFVTAFATENRFEQGIQVLNLTFDPKNIGPFLQWVCKDIEKESKEELRVSGLEWSQVQKGIQVKARTWFLCRDVATTT